MHKKIFAFGLCFCAAVCDIGAGVPGSNVDPDPGPPGVKPYEMIDRTDDYPPVVTFEDCTQWLLEAHNAEAALYRTQEAVLYREYAGKLQFRATGDNPVIVLRPKDTVILPEPFDAVAVWNHGKIWPWEPWEKNRPRPQMKVLLKDANGREFKVSHFSLMDYDYWFYQRAKVPDDLVRPVELVGLEFTHFANDKAMSLYLDCVYAYQTSTKELTFEPWPEKLPFPLREETILPELLVEEFSNESALDTENGKALFTYNGSDETLSWSWDLTQNFTDGLRVTGSSGSFRPMVNAHVILSNGERAEMNLQKYGMKDNVLSLEYVAESDTLRTEIACDVHLNQKSLIFDFKEVGDSVGNVSSLELGRAEDTADAKLFRMPYLTYGWEEKDPRMLLSKGLFVFSQFDWYKSNASDLFGGNEIGQNFAKFNGSAIYNSISDGTRNPLQERLFLTASSEPWEVFPTVDNPASPFKEIQGERVWRIIFGSHSSQQVEQNTHLRNLGMEKVTIRYHEEIWRDSGESFTFRLNSAPSRGGDDALRQFVADIQALGWKIGLYTNYTDYAPVSQAWDEDNVLWLQDGNWLTSWTRCYSPKPMFAVEQEAKLAPQIQAKFGEDHSYCDVHTAVTPFSRVDYDARVPGAGMFRRTFECYGRLLYNEKFAHKGPVFSEGGHHWWYAGLVDGNYAQIISNNRPAEKWFPDFHLRKLHPLEIDVAVGAPGMFFSAPPWNIPHYMATSLVYGNIGFLEGGCSDDILMKIYYLMQPVQSAYVMEPVQAVYYVDADGREYVTRDALANGVWQEGRIHIVYENGTELRANSNPEAWDSLPQWGWNVRSADNKSYSVRTLVDGKVVEAAVGPVSCYFASESENAFGGMSGQGAVALKLEKDGWELIPALQYSSFSFAPGLIGMDGEELWAVAVDAEGKELSRELLQKAENGNYLAPEQKDGVFKYLLRKN